MEEEGGEAGEPAAKRSLVCHLGEREKGRGDRGSSFTILDLPEEMICQVRPGCPGCSYYCLLHLARLSRCSPSCLSRRSAPWRGSVASLGLSSFMQGKKPARLHIESG